MRVFFFFLLHLSSSAVHAAAASSETPQPSPNGLLASVTIHTTLPHEDNHPASQLIDGDQQSYFWISRALNKNDLIDLELPSELPAGSHLILHDGLNHGGDAFDGGVIESSVDGNHWETIGTRRAGVLSATTTAPCHFLRLRATRAINHRVALRELEIVDAAPVLIRHQTITHQRESIPLSIACALDKHPEHRPVADQLSAAFFKTWPRLVKLLGAAAMESIRDVDVIFASELNHPAHASGHTIVISAEHLRRDPGDAIGVFIHELTHIIQRYPAGQPAWFIEGAADYTRFLLHPTDAWAKRCRNHIPRDRPLDAYWSSAAFLLYLEACYQKPIVIPVSQAIASNQYRDEIWQTLTGKSLEQLTEAYRHSDWQPE